MNALSSKDLFSEQSFKTAVLKPNPAKIVPTPINDCIALIWPNSNGVRNLATNSCDPKPRNPIIKLAERR